MKIGSNYHQHLDTNIHRSRLTFPRQLPFPWSCVVKPLDTCSQEHLLLTRMARAETEKKKNVSVEQFPRDRVKNPFMAVSLIETVFELLENELDDSQAKKIPLRVSSSRFLSLSLSLSDSWPGLMKLASSSLAESLVQTWLHHRRSLHLCSSSIIEQDHGSSFTEILSFLFAKDSIFIGS